MADKNDGGEKTELPTPKKLADARKKGDVAKSKEVPASVATIVWLLLFILLSGYTAGRIGDFARTVVDAAATGDFSSNLKNFGRDAITIMLMITATLLIPVAIITTFAERMQTGSIFTGEKMKPGFDKMNPVEGLKRMFGKDGLVELVKNVAKAAIVIAIVYLILLSLMPQLGDMLSVASWSPVAGTGPQAAAASLAITRDLTIKLLAWTGATFVFVAILDRIWSKHSFIKKMMMSRRDIKQEYKNDEGDPHVKQHRRQLHQEFSNSSALGATGGASALLVNPTHIAIALDYDEKDCPVPVIAAKGEGPLAAAMRVEAERAEVPIIRNVAAARALWARGEIGEIVPEDMFDAVAEVILWARKARSGKAPMMTDLDRPTTQAQHASNDDTGNNTNDNSNAG